MNSRTGKSLIERAFELARSCPTTKVVRQRLKAEGYSDREINGHFSGKGLRMQLKAMRRTANDEHRSA